MPGTSFVFPVRYVSEGVAVQTTSRELSALGIAVRALAPPHVGARISMALYLPDTPVPEVAIGRVARSKADDAAEAGFWADFLVVDPHARMRITGMLHDHQQKGQHRLFPRFAVALQFRVRGSGAEFLVDAVNLSRSGVFARSAVPLPINTHVEVEVQFPGAGGTVTTAGIVVHSQPNGVGIQFVDASDGFREGIDRFTDSLAKKA